MNKKELLAGATFLVLYTGFIFTGFGWMLGSQIKAEVAPIKAEVTFIKAEIAPVKAEIALIKENQVRLDTRMDHIEKQMNRMEERIGLEMQEIKSMLGQILVAQNIHHKGKQASKIKKAPKTKVAERKTASL